MRYVVITPAYNEQEYIKYTLDSVINQTLKPFQWIIVNDGSTDKTGEIVQDYVKEYSWIKLIDLQKNDLRACGSKVVRAFNVGYESLKTDDYDFIVKLDADLTLPKNYFEKVAMTFRSDPEIGLCGGYCVNEKNGELVKERSPSYHIRGAFKSITKQCWEEIGGFKEILGWDGIDEMTAMYKGWKTKTIDLSVVHHRPTASAYNPFELSKRLGIANYQNGANVFLAIVRTIVRLFKSEPYIVVGAGFFVGYFTAFIHKEEKNVNKDLARFINKFHLNRIFRALTPHGKR